MKIDPLEFMTQKYFEDYDDLAPSAENIEDLMKTFCRTNGVKRTKLVVINENWDRIIPDNFRIDEYNTFEGKRRSDVISKIYPYEIRQEFKYNKLENILVIKRNKSLKKTIDELNKMDERGNKDRFNDKIILNINTIFRKVVINKVEWKS